nr:RecName: Full=Pregnancy-associated glycoprotein 55B; AltName: Full=EbPAG-B 55 kDa [Bison bonasus]
RGSNLTHPL